MWLTLRPLGLAINLTPTLSKGEGELKIISPYH
jgi:hypothetical protein